MNALWLLPVLLLCGIGQNGVDALLCAQFECDFQLETEFACANETEKAFGTMKYCKGFCYMAETRDLTVLPGNPEGMVASRKYGCSKMPEYEFHKAAKPFAPGVAGGTAKITFDSKEYRIEICQSGDDCQQKNRAEFTEITAEMQKVGDPGQRTCVKQWSSTSEQKTCQGDYCFKFDTYNTGYTMALYQPLLSSGCISGNSPSIDLFPYTWSLDIMPFTEQNKCESIKLKEKMFHLIICNNGDFCNVCDSYTEGQVVYKNATANDAATVTIHLMTLTTITIAMNILKYI